MHGFTIMPNKVSVVSKVCFVYSQTLIVLVDWPCMRFNSCLGCYQCNAVIYCRCCSLVQGRWHQLGLYPPGS